MVGLQSLAPGQAPMPGQGQMAGQPAIPGMLPKPQGVQPGVPALVPSLVGMDMGRLLQMFADPNNPVPKNRILAAMTEKQKEMAARQAVQGQMAMAQAQQQPGTVKDQVVQGAMQAAQPPQMAAHGGVMRGYAGGGAVAFTKGGASEDLRDDESLPLMERIRRARLRQASGGTSLVERPLLDTLVSRLRGETPPPVAQTAASTRTTDTSKLFPFGVPESPMMEVPEIQVAAPAPGPSAAPGGQRRQPSSAPAPAAQPALATTATPANLTPEMARAMQEQEDRLRGRLTRPESLTRAEEGLAALAKANIEAQQAEAKTYGEEIRAARDAALAKAQRDITSDPMSLLAIAGAIDTRRGQGAGSLARGISGLMGEREKQAEAARKEFALAQRDERAMQANVRQTQMLEGQRQVALEKGKLDEVNAINDQLSNLALEREKFRLTRGDVAFQQAMKSREVAAEEEKARAAKISAGKPTELEQRIRLFQQNPEQYRTMFGIDPKETSVELRALKDEEQQLLKRLETTMLPDAKKPIEARLDEIIKMRRTLMGASPVSAPAGTSRPTSKAEFDALPKGARYINPADGKEYIKN